jgi:Zn finger protein HypA/HybF involved in hydrogenase expression
MIRASLTQMIFVYLGSFLALIFANWIIWNISRLRVERQALQHRLRCALCSFEFKDASDDLLPRCPHCGSLNERTPFRTL